VQSEIALSCPYFYKLESFVLTSAFSSSCMIAAVAAAVGQRALCSPHVNPSLGNFVASQDQVTLWMIFISLSVAGADC